MEQDNISFILHLISGGKSDLKAGPSSDVDCPAASSLELSPSNSSGGTYMWDEEGMEPLGHNTHMHRCSSYESDLNSIVSTHTLCQNDNFSDGLLPLLSYRVTV